MPIVGTGDRSAPVAAHEQVPAEPQPAPEHDPAAQTRPRDQGNRLAQRWGPPPRSADHLVADDGGTDEAVAREGDGWCHCRERTTPTPSQTRKPKARAG